ncbi:MAG TPA: ATP-grasp domain-containing protein [Vulgatibacter sp.]|nr:ATP-grasp domain-containing protein [Vulgatibacter sp.]
MPSDVVMLFGGLSREHVVSIASAKYLAAELPEATYWYESEAGPVFEVGREELLGLDRPFEQAFVPARAPIHSGLREAIDAGALAGKVVFFAWHGGRGEDGTVQRWLDDAGVAYTGSGAAASALCFDKDLAREAVAAAGLRVPRGTRLSDSDAFALLADFGGVALKPIADGSSNGLFLVHDRDALERALAVIDDRAAYLIEEFVHGTELTVGVIDEPSGPRALPCTEVRLERGRVFDFAGKYLGQGTAEITPAEIPAEAAAAAQEMAVRAHEALGCRGYSRTDMILAAGGPVYLETNTLPGMTHASFIPQQLRAAGIPMRAFLERQIAVARTR